MNVYDFGTFKQPTGWIAYYRRVHDGQNTVLRHKGDDIIFATELEALKAAGEAFLEYVNCPVVGATMTTVTRSSAPKARAEQIFKTKDEVAA
jgi:predicted nucleotide-binding protein (sugar kinase/HSP70/actin superfamily)